MGNALRGKNASQIRPAYRQTGSPKMGRGDKDSHGLEQPIGHDYSFDV